MRAKTKIENYLNQHMQNLLSYFCKNELVINLKKGKAETMLFGTTKRLKTAVKILLKPINILEIQLIII